MHVRTIVGVALVAVLAAVPLGAQGRSAGAHGNPHPQGGRPQGTPQGPRTTPPAPQGPKSPNPGAGHAEGAGRPEGAGQGSKTGRPEGAHGPMTISERLAAQPQLSHRLQGMLPAGMTIDQAADGFKNLGQFVAAVNVSQNLGIPFADLKAQVTGPSAVSLGGAIHTLKPDADASAAVQQAQAAARDMTRGAKP